MKLTIVKNKLITNMPHTYSRFLKFSVSGALSAFINLGTLYILIRYLGLNTRFLENIANALSMEFSIIFNFFLSRFWTWGDAQKEYNFKLLRQCAVFHLVVGISIGIRLITFPILQYFEVHYLLNAIVGIGLGAIVNYILYDRIVFKKGG